MIPIDFLVTYKCADTHFHRALQLLQLGDIVSASESLSHSVCPTNDPEMVFLKGYTSRQLTAAPTQEAPTLVWQINPNTFEGDWLRFLLHSSYAHEVLDGAHEFSSPTMVVVDQKLDKKKEAYYRHQFEQGRRVCLIHLSDEFFVDDITTYRWCSSVLRNYWSPFLTAFSHVKIFPLGYKAGFASAEDSVERHFVWSFAGYPKKTTRKAMLDAMRRVSGGQLHLTGGFHCKSNLAVAEYRQLMSSSIFVPCPTGNANRDSFRVCEALEAGCIPIVERSPSYDYFRHLFGTHPMLNVSSWEQAPFLIEALLATGEVEGLRKQCFAWWQDYKYHLCIEIRRLIASTFNPF